MATSHPFRFKNAAVLALGLTIVTGGLANAYADAPKTLEQLRYTAGARQVGKMWLQAGIPKEQAKLLLRDGKVLENFKFGSLDSMAISYVLGLSSVNAANLTRWLEARVQVVVHENFDWGKSLVFFPSATQFENPGVLPIIETSSVKPTGKGVIIMSNVGVGVYHFAKTSQLAVGLKVPGVGTVEVNSPRAGVIKIGPGLFMGRRIVDGKNLEADANSIPRLATFYHEARHSDGNGKSLGFFHAVCPEGHPLAGYYACDRNLNGPYTVEAWTTRGMTEGCTQCTVDQREKLRLQYLDEFGRVLPTQLDGKPTEYLDPSPEGKR